MFEIMDGRSLLLVVRILVHNMDFRYGKIRTGMDFIFGRIRTDEIFEKLK